MIGTVVGGGAPPGLVTWEIEALSLAGGATVATDREGFNGAGFVDFTAPEGESVTWTLEVQQTGRYAIGFRYALAATPRTETGRPLLLTIDGVDAGVLPFLPSGATFTDWTILWAEVPLPAGTVTLRVESIGSSGANLDQVSIESVPVVMLNTAPVITGAVAPLTVTSGISTTIALAGVTLEDGDVADPLTAVLTLADGSPLPSFLLFDATTLELTTRPAAVAGSYALALRASDGQALSATAVAFTLEVRAGATVPVDFDGDGLRNRRDLNDDNDGLLDLADPFQFDAANGRGMRIGAGDRVVLDFSTLPDGVPAGWGFGMTGVMANGVTTPEDLGLGAPGLRIAEGALRIDGAGTGTLAADTLLHGAQFGIDADARFLTISVLIDNPYDTHSAVAGESFGLVIGTGDQDNYFRLSLQAVNANSVALRLDSERGGVAGPRATYTVDRPALAGANAGDTIRLIFELDTLTGTLVPRWVIETAGATVSGSGGAVTMNGAVLAAARGDGPTGLAIGVAANSGAGQALDLDVLEFSVEGAAGGAPDITLRGLDAAVFADRLVFNWIDDPSQNLVPDREYKDTGVVRISNTGDGALRISELLLDGPFKFLDATDAGVRTLAAGATLEIEIGFDRSLFTPPPRGTGGQFDGALRVLSDDPDEAVATITLAGWWQTLPEAGREPSLNDILEVFGFGNRVDVNLLASGHYVQASPEEVLAPYWEVAPGYTQASVVQLASFKDAGISAFLLHEPGVFAKAKSVLQQDDLWNQSFFPQLSDGSAITKFISDATVPDDWFGDDYFGLRSSGNSSDPTLNRDPGAGGVIRGHYVRIFQATDAGGTAIADTYLMCVDFNGSNADYNDTVYLISGIAPIADLLLV